MIIIIIVITIITQTCHPIKNNQTLLTLLPLQYVLQRRRVR